MVHLAIQVIRHAFNITFGYSAPELNYRLVVPLRISPPTAFSAVNDLDEPSIFLPFSEQANLPARLELWMRQTDFMTLHAVQLSPDDPRPGLIKASINRARKQQSKAA